MEVREGYKITEVAIIPVDWDIKRLKEVTNIDPENLRNDTNLDYRFNYVSLEDVKEGTLINISEFIFKNAPSRARRKIKKGDVLLGTVRPNLKSHFYVQDEVSDFICSTGFAVIRTDPIKYSSKYIYHHLFGNTVNKQILGILIGSNYPAVNSGDVKKLLVPFPPTLEEQQAIATALSDTDALIDALDRLIAKKRKIKQGAMQELLTLKKRLPGFTGEWEVKRLPNICWFQEGPGVRKTQFTSLGIKLLNGTNIYKGKLYLEKTDRYISEKEAYGPYSHFLANKGDIVIACSGITVERFDEKIAFIKRDHLPLCMNTSTMRFKPKKNELISSYLYYFLMSSNFKIQISGKATGSAQLNFGPSHVSKVNILLPNITEQEAIVQILSDMDTEIEASEQKQDKYKQIKQGLMQELLTGKTKLI